MRTVLGVIVGIIVAFVVQSAADFLGNQLYPPRISDVLNREQIAAALAARPTGALWLGVGGYFLGGLAGGWIGKRISGSAASAWVPAALLGLMALLIGFSFPVPTWATIATFAAALLGGMVANHLAKPGGADASAKTATGADA